MLYKTPLHICKWLLNSIQMNLEICDFFISIDMYGPLLILIVSPYN